jgi:hypothetical protein
MIRNQITLSRRMERSALSNRDFLFRASSQIVNLLTNIIAPHCSEPALSLVRELETELRSVISDFAFTCRAHVKGLPRNIGEFGLVFGSYSEPVLMRTY